MDAPDPAQITTQPDQAASAPPAVYFLPGAAEGRVRDAECLPERQAAEMRALFAAFEQSADIEYPNPRAILKKPELFSTQEGPGRIVRNPAGEPDKEDAGAVRARRSTFGSAVILGGFPAATLAIGVVMMVGALAGGRVVSNPYLALYLLIAGVGLGLTSWTALRVRD